MIGDSAPLHRLGFHPDTHASRRVRGFPPIKLNVDRELHAMRTV